MKKNPHSSSQSMNNMLWLTAQEKLLFDALPSSLKEGWIVEVETGSYEDTSEKQKMRMAVMQIQSPELKSLAQKLGNNPSAPEFQSFVDQLNVEAISESDILQVFFGLGPTALTTMIVDGLTRMKTDADLLALSGLCEYRNLFYISLAEKPL